MEVTLHLPDGEDRTAYVDQIGGRGSGGSMNWGTRMPFEDREPLEDTARTLRKHVGEPVVLTGGGGPGMELAVLEDARVRECGDGWGLRAEVTVYGGKLTAGRFSVKDVGDAFTPWVDSWCVHVFPDEAAREAAQRIVDANREAAEVSR